MTSKFSFKALRSDPEVVSFFQTILWFVVVLVAFLGIKLIGFAPRFSDGGIYLAMGKAITQGQLPYKDFFYSSPPLLPYLFSCFYWLGGATWQLMTAFPLFLTCIDAILLFFVFRSFASVKASRIGVLIYLFSTVVLATTDFPTDIHLPVTLLIGAWLLLRNKKYALSGIVLGIATITKMYMLIPLLAITASLFWDNEKKGVARFLLGWLAIFGSISVIFLFLFGSTYADATFFIHFSKPLGIDKSALFSFFFSHDLLLLLPLLLVIGYQKNIIALPVIMLLSLVTFSIFFKDIYYLYFKLSVPFLAYWWVWVQESLEQFSFSKGYKVLLGIALVVGIISNSASYAITQADKAQINNLSTLVSLTQKLTTYDETMYGDNEIAPLLSVLANRNIAGNFIDTNTKFFSMGIMDLATRGDDLVKIKNRLLITKATVSNKDNKITSMSSIVSKAYIMDHCSLATSIPIYNDYTDNELLFWLCK